MNGQPQDLKAACPAGQVMIERTVEFGKRMDRHEEDHKIEMRDVWDAINSLRNRLPNWAVFLIAALTAICGWLAAIVKG